MRMIGVLTALVVGLSSVAFAQATTPGQPVQPAPSTTNPQQMPARPLRPGETPPKGTGVLKGQVIAAGTGAPVRRAQIRAMSSEGRGGVTSTNNEGRWEIRDLPAGRYSISAMKGGFAQASYGQRRPGEPGTPIDLGEGQTAERVNFIMSRGGVIAGRIVDDGGEPVAGTGVSAMRFMFMSGARRLVPGGGEGSQDRTDDQGYFRLYGLPSGEYYVSANASNNNNFMMPGVNNTEADGFAPTYFPGTPSVAEATRIPLKAGQEMTGANFALIVARLARVRGRAVNSSGEPIIGGMLMLAPADPVMGMNFGMNMRNAQVAADGSFQFANIPPGRYNLNVRPRGMPGANSEFAVVPVTVGNDDIDNLIVTTGAGATVTGVITTDDGSIPPFRADAVQIFAQQMDPSFTMIGGGPTKVNDDFTFEMNSVFDRRMIRANVGVGPAAMNSGWYLKAVLYDGQDVTDTGIDFQPGRSYEGVQVVFTQKTTEVSGLVTDDRGRPVVDASVIIFPATRDKWISMSRFIRTLRPDTNGKYSVKAMPPSDEYLIIAVQNLEAGQFSDPEFLDRAREEAKPFSLNEGEFKTVDIRLSTLVP